MAKQPEKAILPQRQKQEKSEHIRLLIEATVTILLELGIPLEGITQKRKERTALAFLALAGVREKLSELNKITQPKPLRTREIISYMNEHFEENISSGSYDDIRRKDLKPLVLAGLAINEGELKGSATNDSTRAYSLNPEVRTLLLAYGTKKWDSRLQQFKETHQSLREAIQRKRELNKIKVTLPQGFSYDLSKGKHNELQKAVIEQFLPRFAHSAEILYFGDTSNKKLHKVGAKLKKLGIFELAHDELPDIIAYDEGRNWLFLIEAVHSSGPMSEYRVLELKRLLSDLSVPLVFVTAFLDRASFRTWASQIAWETEVWIADAPDHMIHFNGDKFLGPYTPATG